MKHKILSVDFEIDPIHYLNTIFILMVLYLHQETYTGFFLGGHILHYLLQKIAVGGFVILSGLKLSISNDKTPVLLFIKKRFFRLYFLYLIALLLISFTAYPSMHDGHIPSLQNYIVHIFCLQYIIPNHFGPTLPTIWFISTLFCCYIQFIFFRRYLSDTKKLLKYSCIVFIVCSILHFISVSFGFDIFNFYLPLYLALFSIGMALSTKRLNTVSVKKYILLFLGSTIFLIFIYSHITVNTIHEYVVWSAFVLVNVYSFLLMSFIFLSRLFVSNRLDNLVAHISTASLCVFLFHRSIWTIMDALYPQQSIYKLMYIIFLGIPLVFFISYHIQKRYNMMLSKIGRNPRTTHQYPQR